MAGGSVFYGQDGNTDTHVHNRSGFTASSSGSSGKTILVPTMLNFSNEEVRFWNNLTFFFDRWWEPEPDRLTLPFCMFQIAQYSEAQQVELSNKRVMIYQPPNEAAGTDAELVTQGGAMQVVTDNVVVKPKTYNLTLVVPSAPVGRWIKSRMQLKTYLQQVLSGFESGLDENTVAFMQGEMNKVADTTDIMREFMAMANIQVPNINMAENDSGRNAINKNSLDAMCEHGRIIMLKTWQGSDYKYVVITDKTAEKKGTEDGVWRVSLRVQEVPLLSLTPVKGTASKATQGWVQGYTDRWGKVFGIKDMGTNLPVFAKGETTDES